MGMQTGQKYIFGENGPEDFTPTRGGKQYGNSGGGGQVPYIADVRFEGQHFVVAMKRWTPMVNQGIIGRGS